MNFSRGDPDYEHDLITMEIYRCRCCRKCNRAIADNSRCGRFITLRAKLSGAVYCNRSCLFVCGSVTTITRNCVHRSSPV